MTPYLWLKALHVGAAVTWVGGLLVAALALAAGASQGAPSGRGWLDVARRWDRRVTTPAMVAVWTLGVVMAVQGGWFTSHWLTVKLVVVAALSAAHGMLSGRLRRAARGGAVALPLGDYAAPAVVGATLAIAILVIVKPL